MLTGTLVGKKTNKQYRMVQDDRKMPDRIAEVIGGNVEMGPGMNQRRHSVDLIEAWDPNHCIPCN